ncbi:hypothetical protein CASFOL_021062 [Castilleja foliolosa]|uniref:VQ domain-containing protein n=1 Tax=Castilleja foliolosa TaxID=1961234 RepID=A0ABD3CWD7_9LAMI
MDRDWDNESSSMSSSSSLSNNNSNSNMFLKQANKNSHKISKPIRKPIPLPNPPSIPAIDPTHHYLGPARIPPQSQQPAVYNINKNDFRDVVQKLTGSPSHERLPTPPLPAATHPRPPSSRLQRIRPPPLSQINNRPNQISQIHPHPQNGGGQRPPPPQVQQFPPVHPGAESPISAYMRFLQNAPSPLYGGPRPDSLPPQNVFGQRPPPLPLSPMHPAAESPISAYMRYLQSSAPSPMWNGGSRPNQQNEFGQRPLPPPPFSPLQPAESPVSAYMRFLQSPGGVGPRPPHPPFAAPSQPQPPTPPGAFPAAMPLSPLPFGCIPSPRSPYGMMSPGFLFSPMGQLGFPPLSPTFPILSPRWRGM